MITCMERLHSIYGNPLSSSIPLPYHFIQVDTIHKECQENMSDSSQDAGSRLRLTQKMVWFIEISCESKGQYQYMKSNIIYFF